MYIRRFSKLSLIVIFTILQFPALCQSPQQQTANIDDYIASLEYRVNTFYDNQLMQLQLGLEQQMSLLEVADKGDYSSMAARANLAKAVLGLSERGLRSYQFYDPTIKRNLRLKPYEYHSHDIAHRPNFISTLKNAPRLLAVAQSLVAQKKSRIRNAYAMQMQQLQLNRQYSLIVGLQKLKEKLINHSTTQKPAVDPHMVTGIVYSHDLASAVVGGKLVHCGHEIDGVKVVKIRQDHVVFEKAAHQWPQQVGQPPAKFWQ